MSDYQQKIAETFSERRRLNQLRKRKENLRFWNELRIIPRWLFVLVAMLYVLALVIALTVNMAQSHDPNGNEMFPPELRDTPVLAQLALSGLVTLMSLFLASFLFMIAYVNRDASRRGMNSALWTILVIVFLPTWGLIGLVIYLLMREPLPYPCPECATTVNARFNFCPNCKCNLHPACPQCKREVGELDKFCSYCASDLSSASSVQKSAKSEETAINS
ncbi:MAG TPA: zinc ribbon domain-containing protein [Candidatus Cybelea sp.]|nr:zinc ribbon domain-containing protein [Candidatus Cybelea sp.]